jgi:hypothetical protein
MKENLPGENSPESLMKRTKDRIIDVFNDFSYLRLLLQIHNGDFEEIRKKTEMFDIKTLEEKFAKNAGVKPEAASGQIDEFMPGLREKYDELAQRIKNPDLKYEEYVETLKEAEKLLAEVKKIKR